VDRLIRAPFQFVGGLAMFLLEEAVELYDTLTGREAKFRRYQAEQRARLNSSYYD
jgi:hypothetical protein